MNKLDKDFLDKLISFKKVFEKTLTLIEKIIAESLSEKKNQKRVLEDLQSIKSYVNETEIKLKRIKNKLDLK